jgi:hypothetical protein
VERLQLEWFAPVAPASALILPPIAARWYAAPVLRPLTALVLTAVPVTACIAMTRDRLYDIRPRRQQTVP